MKTSHYDFFALFFISLFFLFIHLDLTVPYDRAVAFSLLHLAATHQTLTIDEMSLDGKVISLVQVLNNDKQVSPVRSGCRTRVNSTGNNTGNNTSTSTSGSTNKYLHPSARIGPNTQENNRESSTENSHNGHEVDSIDDQRTISEMHIIELNSIAKNLMTKGYIREIFRQVDHDRLHLGAINNVQLRYSAYYFRILL